MSEASTATYERTTDMEQATISKATPPAYSRDSISDMPARHPCAQGLEISLEYVQKSACAISLHQTAAASAQQLCVHSHLTPVLRPCRLPRQTPAQHTMHTCACTAAPCVAALAAAHATAAGAGTAAAAAVASSSSAAAR
jgi:hypothetical protein